MAVPTSGSFKMFDITDPTSIRGAISSSQINIVSGVDNFEGLVSSSAGWQFDPNYAGIISEPLFDVTSSLQYRNYPVSDTPPPPPPISCYTWKAGADMTTGRMSGAGAGSVGGEAVVFGGDCSIYTNVTEEYNGFTWSGGGNMINCSINRAGMGIQNAALAAGGTSNSGDLAVSEEYDGSNWSGGGVLPGTQAKTLLAGAGIQNSAVIFGGQGFGFPYPPLLTCTDEYNGTAWSNNPSGALTTARRALVGFGTQNAATAVGGFGPTVLGGSVLTCTEEYNGTSWSTGGAMGTARQNFAGNGTQEGGLVYGGTNATNFVLSTAEVYNGQTWSSTGAMINARALHMGAGSIDSAIVAGGSISTSAPYAPTFLTEEYGIVPLGGWDIRSTFTRERTKGVGFGTQDAAVFAGGTAPNGNNLVTQGDTDVWNGSTWSYTAELTNRRYAGGGAGTSNAGLFVAGTFCASPYACFALNCTEEWNGSSWSTAADFPDVGAEALGTVGTQNAALAFGGSRTPSQAHCCSYEYDGSTWATGVSLGECRRQNSGAGIQNAAVMFGGQIDGGPSGFDETITTKNYNGSSWSSGDNMNVGRWNLGGGGTQNVAVAFGGFCTVYNAPYYVVYTLSCTEAYDGVAWSSAGPMIGNTGNATAMGNRGSAGGATGGGALAMGGTVGDTGQIVNWTEEYTPPS